jgi:hypothetical protein
MKPGEKRRNTRRSVSYPAFLDVGDDAPPRECILCDASQEGALLTVADPKTLPDEFTLALSVDGAARRRCRVMWRGKDQIGVSFVKAFNAPIRPLDVSHEIAPPVPAAGPEPLELQLPDAPATAPREAEPDAPPAVDESDMFDIDTLMRT